MSTMFSAAFESPSLDLPVTEEQRERALSFLQQAYAERRLTEYELDARLGIVLQARTRREMNRAFDGLARIPVGTGAGLLLPRTPGGPTAPGRLLGGMAHLSGMATSVVGPGICYALAPRDSWSRHEAAKAFNFQLAVALVAVATNLLFTGWTQALVGGLLGTVWLVLGLLGGVHALAGEQWRNPLTRVVPVRVLDEGPRPRRRNSLSRALPSR